MKVHAYDTQGFIGKTIASLRTDAGFARIVFTDRSSVEFSDCGAWDDGKEKTEVYELKKEIARYFELAEFVPLLKDHYPKGPQPIPRETQALFDEFDALRKKLSKGNNP